MRKTLVLMTAGLAMLGAQAQAATIFVNNDIVLSETWTADNEYVLTQPIYVTSGATLTIQAGTVVRGEGQSAPGANDPGTLIVARDSKIRALGTEDAPVVFTDLNDDNIGGSPGTNPYDTLGNALGLTGRWGGLILLGRGYVANNTLAGPDAARENQIEGLTADGGKGLYGGCSADVTAPLCDDDDSGTLSYVSLRYGGFNLSANNEINGLTLGAVGRETDLDHIEVFQNKDDGVEFFGGTANIRNLVVANAGDDGVDYDEGWRGKAQFVFVMQGTPGTDKSDKGAEQDGGNNPDGSQPFAIPTLYNMTLVGLGQKGYTDKLKNTGLHFRDNAGGRHYNGFLADFGGATLCIEGGSTGGSATGPNTSGERSVTNYTPDGSFYRDPDSDFQLELQDNAFWCFGNAGVVPTGDATAFGCDSGKIHHDNGAFTNLALDNDYFACASALPIRTLTRTSVGDPSKPDPVTSIDPRPAPSSPLNTTDRTPPKDGVFQPATFKGAFSTRSNWAAGWTNMARLDYFTVCDTLNAPLAVPDEVREVRFADKTTLSWRAVPFNVLVYDVLRSPNAQDFTAADCVETDDTDTTAQDATTPAAGVVFYYLVRAENDCGEGSLGTRSDGVERTGTSCP